MQGPPGTGKSHLGRALVKILLDNQLLFDSPILLLCYKNDSLDSFLEKCIKTNNDVVRSGSRCKNEFVKSYSHDRKETKNARKQIKPLFEDLQSDTARFIFDHSLDLQADVSISWNVFNKAQIERDFNKVKQAKIIAMTVSTAAKQS